MKTMILGAVAALTFGGIAFAQQPTQAQMGDITRTAAIADAERRFAALDTNRNGQLEAAEMQQLMEQRRAERRQQMEQRLSRMSDEDRAAFEQRRAKRGGAEGARQGGPGLGRGADRGPVTLAQYRAQAEQRFDRLDLDRNGVITRAEQEQLRSQRGRKSE